MRKNLVTLITNGKTSIFTSLVILTAVTAVLSPMGGPKTNIDSSIGVIENSGANVEKILEDKYGVSLTESDATITVTRMKNEKFEVKNQYGEKAKVKLSLTNKSQDLIATINGRELPIIDYGEY